ncbi:MAG: sulfite exporter TauE/SafE family protein, partial [Methanobrevibacter sp.]|nr:sulfite exporter TauE/SafE family protein [Methanobrevibacter sp.]
MMFPIEYFIGLMLIGICAGFASGLLGVGGGFLIVPLQYFLLKYVGVNPDLAMLISIGTSLAIIIPTALSGAYRHTREMEDIVKPGLQLGIFGIVGGAIGGFVASSLSSQILEIIFGCLLLFVAIKNIVDLNKEREEAKIPFNIVSSAIIGILVGFASGLLGIGGGVFLIVILTALLGFS